MEVIPVDTGFIHLDVLLKLAGAAETGGHTRLAVQNGEVLIDGEACTIHGKKMRGSDRTEHQGSIYEVKAL